MCKSVSVINHSASVMRIFFLSLLLLSPVSALCQGSLTFENRGLVDPELGLYDAPVSLPNGSTAAGDAFIAGVFLLNGNSLDLLGTSTFRSGGAAGFFFPTEVFVPGFPQGSQVILRARVWETAAGSYDAA